MLGGKKAPPGPSFAAYAPTGPERQRAASSLWKVWLVGADCFLIGLQPVLVHMSKVDGKFSFNPVSVNLLVELAKTVFAITVLLMYGSGRPGPRYYRSVGAFLKDAHHNRLLAVPAGLYALNNYLKFAMQLHFKPTTAKMLGNLKILVIAFLMKGVLKRQFNIFQWEALVLLCVGVTVNQLSYCNASSGGMSDVALIAVVYTLGSITVPSLASVYNELALKKHMDTSINVQNLFLYLYGAAFNAAGLVAVCTLGSQRFSGILQGHSRVTAMLVVNNALQGVLSSFFFKYADTILKKYSSTLATIFTALMSWALFGHSLTVNFLLGVTVVFISMHQFFSQGGLKGAKQPTQPAQRFMPSPSMDHIALVAASTDSLAALENGNGYADSDSLHPRRMLLPK